MAMETGRLLIRPMKESDENTFVNGIADRGLRVLYGFPAEMDISVPPEIFHLFCKLPRAYSIVEKKTNSMIGFLLDVDPELPEDILKGLSGKGRTLAFATFPPYQRQGYMEETLNAYVSYQLQNNGIEYIHCGHFTDNDPSRCLLQKLGFTEYSRHAFKDRIIIDQIIQKMNGNIMNITIKKMETDDEIKGKAYVHWQSWHEAYPGIVSQDYLDRFTLEKAEKMAFRWGRDHLFVAKAGDRVIGFVGYGDRGEEAPETGEIFALYILSEYYGTGVGKQLMDAGLEQLKGYPQICLWVLKDNKRAIRFYEKCGFHPDGQEMFSKNVEATEIRMILHKQA